ncbi:MAG: hypothetical protein M1837_004024 [Sclerophora amabilis]|nr:MAG: hypothetical protein M1837_004024 [Sclerophora amabilis]
MAFPNSPGGTGGPPDLMNDPAYATNTAKDGNSISADSETCRICRSEATQEEQLFHPCKCSGSIKFVHQECLMEWLSHSQKKHCELCKTPFRFTKLYSPEMPKSLPNMVFIRHLVTQGFKSTMTWSRFLLVSFVWLGWLPWSMRAIWRLLFWLGDGEWVLFRDLSRALSPAEEALAISRERLSQAASDAPALGRTSSAMVTPSSSRGAGTFSIALPSVLAPVSQTLNMSASEPMILRLVRRIFRLDTSPMNLSPNASEHFNVTTPRLQHVQSPSSVLSQLPIFSEITRFPSLNKLLIDTFEGQMITLLVVVAFILIFLIREWVVQQQPGLNMGADFDADMAEGPRDEGGRLDENIDDEAEADRDDQAEEHGNPHDDLAGSNDLDPAEVHGRARPLARARRRVHFPPPTEEARDSALRDELSHNFAVDTAGNHFTDTPQSSQFQSQANESSQSLGESHSRATTHHRPPLPSRDALSKVAEIRRTLEEENRLGDGGWPKLKAYTDTWHTADGQPTDVLQMLDEGGHTDKLAHLVVLMNRLQTNKSEGNMIAAARTRSTLADLVISGADIMEDYVGETAENIVKLLDSATDVDGAERLGPYRSRKSMRNFMDPNFGSHGEQTAATGSSIANGPFWGSGEDDIYSTGDPDERTTARVLSVHKYSPEKEVTKTPAGSPHWRGDPIISNNDLLGRLNGGPSQDDTSSDSSSVSDGSLLDRTRVAPLINEEHDVTSAQTPEDARAMDSGPTHSGGERPMVDRDVNEIRAAYKGRLDRLMDWLWGDVLPESLQYQVAHQNDEHVIQDLDDEPPFVHVNHEPRNDQGRGVVEELEPDVLAREAPVAPEVDPNDLEAIEDGEEFDGVMELIGMRGPLAGLFQNAMFSAILISLTVSLGIWLPYIWGKMVFVILGNPILLFVKVPLRCFSAIANLVVDLALFFTGSFIYWTDRLLRFALNPLALTNNTIAKFTSNLYVANTTKSVAEGGLNRITKLAIDTSLQLKENDIPIFSMASHQTLQSIKANVWAILTGILHIITALCEGESVQITLQEFYRPTVSMFLDLAKDVATFASSPFSLNSIKLSLDSAGRSLPLEPSLAHWGAWDRTIAILTGYIVFSIIGALYLKKGSPFSTSEQGKKIEGVVTEILQQAGGVLKVILIISIEMIVFPLYCGLLLDVALLPLFEMATFESRINFTLHSPWTSIFVHWFVGTCYMFHFALFVSMCRRIMRRGVLYFIRDPDDPTFHPVRDVLERNVATQLRKIAFSGLVYGALVIICLGGVVWGLSYAFEGVLPIHWSSNEPVLEFPVDLLFYNFFMPLAVNFMRPSDGLHKMYTWWFQKCARGLRLSWFLFGERHEDEEGRHIQRSWKDTLCGKKGDARHPVVGEDIKTVFEDGFADAYFFRDGRYVRTPASDQVRFPKGGQVFLEVNEQNERLDGQVDRDDGPHGRKSDQFTKVYVPPWFRVRIGLFIFFIWIFAALTGVGITIVPLVFGRSIFATLIPENHRMNDVYAFSIGIYALGGLLYGILRYDRGLYWMRRIVHLNGPNAHPFSRVYVLLQKIQSYTLRSIRLVYFYTAFAVTLPTLFALVMEFYIIIPAHTYLAPQGERHIIHFIQDWTLGVLYVKIAGRLILWYSQSRPAHALRAITHHGWLNPDIRLATRGFILPICVVMGIALLGPLPLGWVANRLFFADGDAMVKIQVYRYSFPAVLAICLGIGALYLLSMLLKRWRMAIRDEVYLIGERLHNFGERRASSAVMGAAAAAGGVQVRT